VQAEGVLERLFELCVGAGHRDLDPTELGELPPPAPMVVALLRGQL
jgi:hypothetical protein